MMLVGRLSFWLCAVLVAGGQLPCRAQLFLVAQQSYTNPPASSQVALGWNPSPDTNATGYFLCWGLANDACTNLLDVGNSTNTTVAGLLTNVTYYFSVVAYDGAGQQSPPSNEITYAVPLNSPVGVGTVLSVRAGVRSDAAVLRLSFPGSAGSTYNIQASQDFQQWVTLWTTNCSSDGLIMFDVTDMENYPSRFYRLAQR